MTKEKVNNIISDQNKKYIRVFKDKNDIDTKAAVVFVNTYPFQVFAQGWVLRIDFENNIIVGLRIRTHDTRHYKPLKAPPDRVTPNSKPVPSWKVEEKHK